MSYVFAAPQLVEAAATDLAALRSAISQATASAAVATTSVLPAGADEISAVISQLFGGHGQEFQAISARATAFHEEFVNLLSQGAGQYAGAEAAGQALLGGAAANAPLENLQSFASSVAAPYQTLFATTAANIQSLRSAISANPTPFLRQLVANQAGYLQTVGTGFVSAMQNVPGEVTNLPAYVQTGVQDLAANFNPAAWAQSVINSQLGYLNTISTSLTAANHDFITGLKALPASFQAAGQAFQAGDSNTAFDDLASGLLSPFITGFSGEFSDTGIVYVTATGSVGDLMPILSIPGQMAQNFTALLPAGSIPAMMSQNFTNVVNTATDTSQWINLGVANPPIPLHVGLPLALALDAIGPVITTGAAAQSSLMSFAAAVQTGNAAGAAAAILGAPAVIANGFLNGQAMLPLNAAVTFPWGGELNSTTYLPLGGILTPLQGGQLMTDIDPGVPYPLGGTVFGGIVPGLLTYLPEQFAQAIGATPPTS